MIGLLLALFLPILADEPAVDPSKADVDRLQGTWVVVAVESGGETIPAGELRDQTIRFEDDAYTVTADGKVEEEGTFRVHARRTPRALDLEIRRGPDRGKTQLAIYQFDGEMLRLCLADAGAKSRPDAFATTASNRWERFTLKRQEP